MKKLFFIFIVCICVCRTLSANDTISVRHLHIPVLLNTSENKIIDIRIKAENATKVDKIVLSLDDDCDLQNIQSLALFYSGTVNYGNNRRFFTDPDYAIKLKEISPVDSRNLTFEPDKTLFPGENHFFVSLCMKPETPLHSRINIKITDVVVNNQHAYITQNDPCSYRMGWSLRHGGDDDVAAYRIPGLATTPKGSLIAVYDVRYHSPGVDLQEHIDVGMSRSTDKGKTWEPMKIIMDVGEWGGLPQTQNGIGDPSVLVDERTGTIWVGALWTHGMGNGFAWKTSQQGMTPDKTGQMLLVKSDDDGLTWSKPVNITGMVKQESWYLLLFGPGKGITMQDGTLVFPIQYQDSARIPSSGIMYSKDRGNTWKITAPAKSQTTEAQVAEVYPGILMLNMRDDRGGSRSVAITKDLGVTWEEHPSSRSALREPVCMASLIKVDANKNSLKKDILLFSNPDNTSRRTHQTIKMSLDGGLSWEKENQVMLDELSGAGYSCLTMIDENTVGILYEGSAAQMCFQTVRLEDFVENP